MFTLEDHIKVFLDEKTFEGCAGLVMTDEIRLTIAAQACLLIMRRPDRDHYPRLYSVLVYPSTYVARTRAPMLTPPGMVVAEGPQVRQGESWHTSTGWGAAAGGPVILSWDNVKRGAFDAEDGSNLVLHEFAHQLDALDGEMNGAPLFDSKEQRDRWMEVIKHEYHALQQAVQSGLPHIINPYGGTNLAEFFACSTESYFERFDDLREERSDLWEVLYEYYGYMR